MSERIEVDGAKPADSGRVDVAAIQSVIAELRNIDDIRKPSPTLGWIGRAADKLQHAITAALAAQGQGDANLAGAPSIEDAEAMGAKGGQVVEAERLAFEAWMRGHCWALSATWDGATYRSDAEQGGKLCPHAMSTRQLWAAWRDRASLTAPPAPPTEGHTVRVLSCDGEWDGEALWESGEGAYVTQQPLMAASPAGVPDVLRETLQKILAADPRKWEELSEPESEFERWAKARARYALSAAPSAPESNT